MMNKWPIAIGSLTAIVIGSVVALAVAGVFDSDSAASPGDGERADTAALCVDGAEDCEDTVVVPTGDESDDIADEPPPGDSEPTPPILDGSQADDDRALAIEVSFAKLEAMGGPSASEFDVFEVRAVDWPNACLGVEAPGIACAQVITPGYVVVLDTGFLAYEFHTDTRGHAVLADPNNPAQ